MTRRCAFLRRFLIGLVLAWSGAAVAGDRHAGYYYPEPESREVYNARAETLPDATRGLRIGFVAGLTKELEARPYAPTYSIFAKGAEAEKLIIVARQDGRLDTIYRARALFASLTGVARLLPIFAELGVQEIFTFFDLAKLLGFKQITISNGRDFAHQVMLN